ncbi:class I SAM-dependent methyltransferase [Geothrix edaphica]|uniref:Class I SAM-dependent methyltransferase n=1 Tax=Geothrix edaphica TaxID=2927976 RepID=A0ABQ5PSY7_9BACT|nr:class I SAM-dependent methyltransferase [Geothrix edaphica]GLH65677.1 hypothetical protein GETHED_00410 [Geothrix edaphica]
MKLWTHIRRLRMARRYRWVAVPCPGCGSDDRNPLVSRDRFGLKSLISQCNSCGLVYTARNIDSQQLDDFYKNHYRFFYESVIRVDDSYVYRSADALKAAYRMARVQETLGDFSRVLELGCGLGFFLREAKARGCREVLGLEPGEAFHAYCVQQNGLNGQVEACSYETLQALPFRPDLVVLFHVLEHMPNPGGCLDWIRAHMDPEGSLVLEVPDLMGDWSDVGLGNFHFGHRTYFSSHSLSHLLKKHGFHVFAKQTDHVGIYPGNLRIFARLRESEGVEVPEEAGLTPAQWVMECLETWASSRWDRRIIKTIACRT